MTMRHQTLLAAMIAELTAILYSTHTQPGTKVLWLVVAAITYWLIARGVRIVHAAQIVVALLGTVVLTLGGTWQAIAYAVETAALLWLWHGDRTRVQAHAARDVERHEPTQGA